MERPLALVTGASSGIGRSFARQLARENHDLILVARRETELRQLAEEAKLLGVTAHVLPLDLGRHDAAEKVKAFADGIGFVSLLINNAGFGKVGPAHEDAPRQLAMIDLNIRTLTALTLAFLPPMLEQRKGGILNIASVAGVQPIPYFAVYGATKAYVIDFTAALHEELRDTGVTATVLCPGPVATEFSDVAEMKAVATGPFEQTPEEVAAAGLDALRSGRSVAYSGVAPAAMGIGSRITPRAMTTWLTGSVFRRLIK